MEEHTTIKSGNSLSEFEKVSIRVKGPFLYGICHKYWQEYIRPICMEKGKRIQKHNRAALTDAPKKVSLREKTAH